MALFAPFRALGYITDPVPFATQKRGGGGAGASGGGGGRDGRGSGGTVTVAVGRTWQTYDSSRLVLRLVGPAHPRDVTAVACKGDLTWAAAGGDVYEARRVHFTTAAAEGEGGGGGDGAAAAKPAYRNGHRAGSRILALLPLGEGDNATLLSLGTDRQLLAWRVGQHGRKPATRIDLSVAGFESGGKKAAAGAKQQKQQIGDPSARPTCICHPDTYLNKVVVGFTDGTLRLYNYATGRHLYTFDVAGPSGGGGASGAFGGVFGRNGNTNTTSRASVRCVAASPALDVVGCGLSDGRVVVHHLRRDARVVEFEAAAGGGAGGGGAGEDGGGDGATPTTAGGMLSLLDRGVGLSTTAASTSTLATSGAAITALCFRPGAGGSVAAGASAAQQPLPLLAVGGGSGGVAFWDLEKRRLHAVLRDAHDAPVVSLHWFPGEPRVMSSGADNAIKQWSLDGKEAVPRLLRFRAGHSSPPTVVAHYGPGGLRLLSAGADRAFRVFSTIQDQQSRELGQGGAAKRARKKGFASEAEAKLPRISALDASDARERDWSNVVTAHEGDPRAYTWRLAHFTLGEAVLQPTPTALRVVNSGGGRLAAGAATAPVSAVAVTPCGNFAVVGSSAGRVDRYNLQSGLHRGGFYRRRRRDKFGLGDEHKPLLAPMPGEEAAAAAAAAGRALLLQSSVSPAAAAGSDDDDGPDGHNKNKKRRALTRRALAASYRPRPTDEVRAAHDGAVVGCAVDSRGRLLVSAGADGFLRIWDFRRQQLVAEAYAGAPIARMAMHPGTGLVAVALAGPVEGAGGAGGAAAASSSAATTPYALRVFDAEAGGRLVRRFPGHTDRVTALQLSSDGRWLLSAGMDGALRVWDLPSGACAQAMAVAGPPITSLSLSPALDLLATAHANRRGVFLWANQALFGDPTAVARLERSAGAEALAAGGGGTGRGAAKAWERLVPVGMPSIGTGHDREEDEEKKKRKKKKAQSKGGDSGSSSEDDESSSDDDEDASSAGDLSASDLSSSSDYVVGHLVGGKRRGAGGQESDDDEEDDAAAAAPTPAHEARDPRTGAPRPLAPRLATLSLLPRAQVDSLLHLDAIRARGRPLAPPKKPEAAPFFLPTVPSLAGHPVFGGGGEGGEGGGEDEGNGNAAAAGSRVKRARLAASGEGPGKHEPPPSSEFVRLLREGERRHEEAAEARAGGGRGNDKADAEDAEDDDNPYAPFIAYALSLTPVALDSELRALALLDVPADGEDDEDEGGPSPLAERETADLLALLTALDLELAAARNYEFCNAVLARALALHGDALSARPKLVAACAALRARLRAGWRALDSLLQGVRCMADFFAGAQ